MTRKSYGLATIFKNYSSVIIQVQTKEIFHSDTYEVLLDDNRRYDILLGNIS